MTETNLIIDTLQCWNADRLSREQVIEVLAILAKSQRGKRAIEQIRDLFNQALEYPSL